MVDTASTLHHADTDLEIHKVVVGPIDNNVFVLRCRHTGDAVLIDAANEHEQLLDLARRSASAGCSRRTATGTTSRRCPQMRDAGYSVGVTADDAAMLPSYDEILDDDSVIEVGDLRLHTILTPGHTPGSMCFLVEGKPLLFCGDTLFPGGPGNTSLRGRRLPDDHPLDRGPDCSRSSRRHDRDARPRRRHDDRRRAPPPPGVGRAGAGERRA